MAAGAENKPPYDGGGVGGKLKKLHGRRPPSTPYSRPLATPALQSGGWIHKLATPASRLASRFLPSVFSTPQPSARSSPEPDNGGSYSPEPDNGDGKQQILEKVCTSIKSDGGLFKPSACKNHTESNIQNTSLSIEVRKNRVDQCHQNHDFPDIENLMKQKTFTRDERERLTKLLHSRLVSSSNDIMQPMNSLEAGLELVEGAVGVESKMPFEEEDDEPSGNLEHDGSASSSPVEIAKAFMRCQVVGPSVTCQGLQEKRTACVHPMSAFPIQPTVEKSPICWPAAAVQKTPSYATPQIQRHRIGLHGFTRAPYSRPSSKLPGIDQWSLTQLRQEATPLSSGNQAAKLTSGLKNSSTVGPIRREHQRTLGVTTPVRGNFSFSLKSAQGLTSSSDVFQPSYFRSSNLKPSESIQNTSVKNYSLDENKKPWGGLSTVHPQSSAMARKILEHLDRVCSSPKAMSDELNIARERTRPTVTFPAVNNPSQEKGVFYDNTGKRHAGETSALKAENQSNCGLGSGVFNSWHPSDSEEGNNIISNPSIESKDADVSQSKSNKDVFRSYRTQFLKVDKSSSNDGWTDKVQQHRHEFSVPRAKPTLSSISVLGRVGKHLTSDSAAGFTFPLAADAHGELPTPTMLTTFGVTNILQSREEDKIPNFTFGSSNSERGPIFTSFTFGSARSETSVPQFSFGPNNTKGRISFSAVGKDVSCC